MSYFQQSKRGEALIDVIPTHDQYLIKAFYAQTINAGTHLCIIEQ